MRQDYSGRDATSRETQDTTQSASASGRTLVDWILILGTTALFAVLALMAKLPHMDIGLGSAVALTVVMLIFLATCGIALWRTTRFR